MEGPLRTATAVELEEALRLPEVWRLLDVRSPSEFAEDHVPGAINIPVLTDEQRRQVGTEYVQGSAHMAQIQGASMASANIAQALATQDIFSDKTSSYMVMCFRGGLRSEALGLVMHSIGFKVSKLAGGYKAYRSHLRERLTRPPEFRGLVIQGPTGCGKTRMLRSLAKSGHPFIDLEAHAGHRGSRFGPIGLNPRRQAAFESHLWADLVRLDSLNSDVGAGLAPPDTTRHIESPVFVEGESMRIGNCYLPRPFWDWMVGQKQVWVDLPREVRARFLVEDYLGSPPEDSRITAFIEILHTLRMELGGARIEDIERKVLSGKHQEAAEILLEHFFDPHYAKHRNNARADITHISASTFEELETSLREALGIDRENPI